MSEQVKISELPQASTPLDVNGLFEFAFAGSSFKASLQNIIDETFDGTLTALDIDDDKDWNAKSITNMDTLALNTVEFATDTTITLVGANLQLEVADTIDEIRFLHGGDNEFVFRGGPEGTSIWNKNDMQQMGKLSFGLIPEVAFIEDGGTSLDLQLRAGTNTMDGTISLFLDQTGVDYIFSDTEANFNNNELINTILTSTVTGVSGITGLGIQTIDLDMDDQAIEFQNWTISDQINGTPKLNIRTTDGEAGQIDFSMNNTEYTIDIGGGTAFIGIFQKSGAPTIPTAFIYQTRVGVLLDNDPVSSTTPLYNMRFNRENPTADVVNRPLIQVQNNSTVEWLLDNDGTVTQFGDLDMGGTNGIIFNQWDVRATSAVSQPVLIWKTVGKTNSEIQYVTDDITRTDSYVNSFNTELAQDSGAVAVLVQPFFVTNVIINASNDEPGTALTVLNTRRSNSPFFISKRFLYEIQNNESSRWRVNFDGTVTQFGDLVMGLNELQFDDTDHFIHQHGLNLEAHVGANQQFRIVIAPETNFTYQFGVTNSNWGGRGMTNMATLSFSSVDVDPALNVSIQRGNNARDGGSNDDLELDANLSGEIIFRILDTEAVDQEEYNFGATIANFNNNQIANAVLLSTVTGDTAITGLGTQGQDLEFASTFGITLNGGTINLGFGNISDANIIGGRIFDIIGAIDVTPVLNSFFTQTTAGTPPPPNDIFKWVFNGNNLSNEETPYAEIFVSQDDLTDLTPKGSIKFDVATGTAIGSVPFMTLDGSTSKLALQNDIDLSFQNTANDGTLILETNTLNNLVFDTRIVKTETQSKFEVKPDPAQTIGTTQSIVTGLTFVLANRIQGKGFITLFLLVDPGSNAQSATFEIINSTGDIFEKVVGIGESSDSNNPITLTIPTDLDGGTITVGATAVSGTFNINAGSYLTVFEVF